MKSIKPNFDALLEEDDQIQAEVLPAIRGGFNLYIHVNGETVVRIGGIPKEQLTTLKQMFKEVA
jgi:hypothetical protein